MTTKLMKVGDQYALILDAETLQSLGIDAETPLEVVVDEAGLHVHRSASAHSVRVLLSATKMMDLHDETFAKLAL